MFKRTMFIFSFLFILSTLSLYAQEVNEETSTESSPAESSPPEEPTHIYDQDNWLSLFGSLYYDSIDGLSSGLYGEARLTTQIAKDHTLSIYTILSDPKLKRSNRGIDYSYYPLEWVGLKLNYYAKNYYAYNVGENNVAYLLSLKYPPIKNFQFSSIGGITTRYVDLDTRVQGGPPRLINILTWNTRFNYTVNDFYTTGFVLGNLYQNQVVSGNYLQLEWTNLINIGKNFIVNASTGMAYAGSIAIAGTINRAWVNVGVTYYVQ